ncbi:MAG: hypothetical protein GXY85_05270 [Candidatus Brocadiaceae bacterium]|nr:hypothetical protein [Candidatus Brocadiaceae bacterium]
MQTARVVLAVLFAVSALTGMSYAETHTAASPAYADVKAAIDAAGPGDTVVVPAGTATWDACLSITKGVVLRGAGVGETVITGNVDDRLGGVIRYWPAAPDLNEPFRITGFTLDGGGKSNVVYLANRTAHAIDKVRIDHNKLVNPGGPGRVVYVSGTVHGVIDNNVIDGGTSAGVYGANETSWANLPLEFGTAASLYFEDNVITGPTFGVSSGQGGRYVMRYNAFSGATSNRWPVFGMPGNQPKLFGTMQAEVYGNRVDMGTFGGLFVSQGGGQALVFGNKVISGPLTCAITEEHDDAIDGATYVQHVTNSYYWQNMRSGTELLPAQHRVYGSGTATGGGEDFLEDSRERLPVSDDGRYGVIIDAGTGAGQARQVVSSAKTRLTVAPKWDTVPDSTSQYRVVRDPRNQVVENREFFNQNDAFDGTAGIGCGPLSERPATGAPGVAYWATDQDCTTVSDANVGAHPTVPIQGTLYKCTEPDTWTEFYTPHAYPHPLRGSGPVADAPAAAQPGPQD